MTGKIIKGIAGFYYVLCEDECLYECKAKGGFRKDGVKPLVGDNVVVRVLDEAKCLGNSGEKKSADPPSGSQCRSGNGCICSGGSGA